MRLVRTVDLLSNQRSLNHNMFWELCLLGDPYSVYLKTKISAVSPGSILSWDVELYTVCWWKHYVVHDVFAMSKSVKFDEEMGAEGWLLREGGWEWKREGAGGQFLDFCFRWFTRWLFDYPKWKILESSGSEVEDNGKNVWVPVRYRYDS